LKDNKKSFYIQKNEWSEYLEEAFEVAILEASIEVSGGIYTPIQLEEIVNKEQSLKIASSLIAFIYEYSVKDLLTTVREYFINLPGGKEWLQRRI
jgi:predicted nucleotidyltransferase